VRPDLFIKKVVILRVAPAEKAAAAVDATELESVLVERVSNSGIDTVIRGSLQTRVIIVKRQNDPGVRS
jgi:predicted methyltransferase MtxX (methanogen marker protein 4)